MDTSTAAKNAACDAIVDLVDAGSTNPEGKLVIKDGATTLVECEMSNPAFGAASSGTATAGAISDGTAVADGTADNYSVVDRDETEIWSDDCGQKRTITAVSQANDTFKVAGDHTSEYAAGKRIRVTGSTGNDGTYKIAKEGSSLDGSDTLIPVDEDIPSAVADGQLHLGSLGLNNASIITSQTVSCSSFTYTAISD